MYVYRVCVCMYVYMLCGDGLNGGLINFFLDGELIIENATIEEPDNFDDTNCWPNCDNPTAIVYSFFGNEGQTRARFR